MARVSWCLDCGSDSPEHNHDCPLVQTAPAVTSCFKTSLSLMVTVGLVASVARSSILTAPDKLAIIRRLLDEYEEANGMSFDA